MSGRRENMELADIKLITSISYPIVWLVSGSPMTSGNSFTPLCTALCAGSSSDTSYAYAAVAARKITGINWITCFMGDLCHRFDSHHIFAY